MCGLCVGVDNTLIYRFISYKLRFGLKKQRCTFLSYSVGGHDKYHRPDGLKANVKADS